MLLLRHTLFYEPDFLDPQQRKLQPGTVITFWLSRSDGHYDIPKGKWKIYTFHNSYLRGLENELFHVWKNNSGNIYSFHLSPASKGLLEFVIVPPEVERKRFVFEITDIDDE